MTTKAFDATTYKTTTRAQWQAAAEAWDRWEPTIDDWLGAATETMLDCARIGTGGRVLDVAAGAGGQTLAAARRVGPTGRILATDIAPAILEYADARLRTAGLLQHRDGRDGRRAPRRAGRVVRRGDLQGRADLLPRSASGAHRHAASPGARRSGRRGQLLDPRAQRLLLGADLGDPGPRAAAAAAARPARTVQPRVPGGRRAGAAGRRLRGRRVRCSCRRRCGWPSAADCLRFEQDSFGALHQMLSGLDDAGRAAAWAEIDVRLREFDTADGFVGPCEMIVVGGSKPAA